MERLSFKDVYFSFGPVEILNRVSFQLDAGETSCFIGPSGCGKTTLLRLAAGLLDLKEGAVENTFQSSAIVFQDARLLPWKSALENILLAILPDKGPRERKIELAREYALKVGLDERDLEKFPKDLSGGMRQRVNLARAIITSPRLLLMDEPFSALDIGIKKELEDLLLDFQRKENMAILFITHDLTEALKLGRKIYLMGSDPGRIVNKYILESSPQERDDDFIYAQAAAFLKDPLIQEAFELGRRAP